VPRWVRSEAELTAEPVPVKDETSPQKSMLTSDTGVPAI
jgi:hypothetical protein